METKDKALYQKVKFLRLKRPGWRAAIAVRKSQVGAGIPSFQQLGAQTQVFFVGVLGLAIIDEPGDPAKPCDSQVQVAVHGFNVVDG